MLWHTSDGRLDNSLARFTRFALSGRQVERIPVQPGLLLAPAYLPTNGDWLLVTVEKNALVRFYQGQETVIAGGGMGDTAFVWSPDGRQIAYAVRQYARDPYYGLLSRL